MSRLIPPSTFPVSAAEGVKLTSSRPLLLAIARAGTGWFAALFGAHGEARREAHFATHAGGDADAHRAEAKVSTGNWNDFTNVNGMLKVISAPIFWCRTG